MRYFNPVSHEGLSATDAVIDALFRNILVYMQNDKDVGNEMRSVLSEADNYLNWLRLRYPAHVQVTERIISVYLLEHFVPYVNGIMDHDPNDFLPPAFRYEFSDFILATGGVDINILQTFRTLFFVVHSFVICNLSNWNEKMKLLDEVISTYDAVLGKTSQGYLFQILCNEKKSLIDYKKRVIQNR